MDWMMRLSDYYPYLLAYASISWMDQWSFFLDLVVTRKYLALVGGNAMVVMACSPLVVFCTSVQRLPSVEISAL